MADWQPIESAPKDGTPFLSCKGARVMWTTYGYNGWESGWLNEHEYVVFPTHWMPLPEPPGAE